MEVLRGPGWRSLEGGGSQRIRVEVLTGWRSSGGWRSLKVQFGGPQGVKVHRGCKSSGWRSSFTGAGVFLRFLLDDVLIRSKESDLHH